MANILYPKGKEHLLNGDIDMDTDTIKVVLVDTDDYTYNAAHDALDDIPGGARVATETLTIPSITDGIFDAENVVFSTVAGDECEALVIYKEGAGEADSWLIAYIDSAVGLPILPNGGNITITWNDGVNKIFAL